MSHVYLIFAYIYLLQYKLWSRIPNLLFFSLSNYFNTIFSETKLLALGVELSKNSF